MDKADCFSILQISPEATLKDARKAYMRLVKRWHPDRFANDPRMLESAQEKLKIINAAYVEVKAVISAGINREAPKSTSKPPPVSPEKSADVHRGNTVGPVEPRSLFSGFRNLIPKGIRRFFSSDPSETPRREGARRNPPKPATPPGSKAEEKDFQKIFNDAVRSKTGKPYRPLKRAKRPIERPERDPKARTQNAAFRAVRTSKKPGDRVARVEPVSKIKGS